MLQYPAFYECTNEIRTSRFLKPGYIVTCTKHNQDSPQGQTTSHNPTFDQFNVTGSPKLHIFELWRLEHPHRHEDNMHTPHREASVRPSCCEATVQTTGTTGTCFTHCLTQFPPLKYFPWYWHFTLHATVVNYYTIVYQKHIWCADSHLPVDGHLKEYFDILGNFCKMLDDKSDATLM